MFLSKQWGLGPINSQEEAPGKCLDWEIVQGGLVPLIECEYGFFHSAKTSGHKVHRQHGLLC
jgi:hypothetical protein